jgi:hypothetical protein
MVYRATVFTLLRCSLLYKYQTVSQHMHIHAIPPIAIRNVQPSMSIFMKLVSAQHH